MSARHDRFGERIDDDDDIVASTVRRCVHCDRPIAPMPDAPDVWVHLRHGRLSTTHCTEGRGGITQAEPPEEEAVP